MKSQNDASFSVPSSVYASDYVKPHIEQPALTSIKQEYDYSKSTTENNAWKGPGPAPMVGKYAGIRCQMDYSYHKYYTPERQHLHDKIIDEALDSTDIDTCEKVEVNWLVFTAGTMGVGKGYVLQWLADEDLFPLNSFVLVDPDLLRERLPCSAEYKRRDPLTAGQFTQKEVGYISEVLTLIGLKAGKNVLVDGSLRDAMWYIKYVQNLKSEFPALNVAIIYVTASLETLLYRAKTRAELTGRHVPEEVIHETFEQVPRSVVALAPYADVIATFENDVINRDCIVTTSNNNTCGTEPVLLNLTYPKLDLAKEKESIKKTEENNRLVHSNPTTPIPMDNNNKIELIPRNSFSMYDLVSYDDLSISKGGSASTSLPSLQIQFNNHSRNNSHDSHPSTRSGESIDMSTSPSNGSVDVSPLRMVSSHSNQCINELELEFGRKPIFPIMNTSSCSSNNNNSNSNKSKEENGKVNGNSDSNNNHTNSSGSGKSSTNDMNKVLSLKSRIVPIPQFNSSFPSNNNNNGSNNSSSSGSSSNAGNSHLFPLTINSARSSNGNNNDGLNHFHHDYSSSGHLNSMNSSSNNSILSHNIHLAGSPLRRLKQLHNHHNNYHHVNNVFLKKNHRNKQEESDDHQLWREEFRKLFEVTCLIPDFNKRPSLPG